MDFNNFHIKSINEFYVFYALFLSSIFVSLVNFVKIEYVFVKNYDENCALYSFA